MQARSDTANFRGDALSTQLGEIADSTSTYWIGEKNADQVQPFLDWNNGNLTQVMNTTIENRESKDAEDMGSLFEDANQYFKSWLNDNEDQDKSNTLRRSIVRSSTLGRSNVRRKHLQRKNLQ